MPVRTSRRRGDVPEIHLLRVGDAGIIEQIIYCTGIWDPETIERYARETAALEPVR